MKFLVLLIICLAICLAKKDKKIKSKSELSIGDQLLLAEKKTDVIGETHNNGERDVFAVTYGIASSGRNLGRDFSGYKTPMMVEKLPSIIAPARPGPIENVEEVPSQTTYYDGSMGLNVAHINCHLISMPTECVRQSICGWCGGSSSCIRGTALAPQEICLSAYSFNGAAPEYFNFKLENNYTYKIKFVYRNVLTFNS